MKSKILGFGSESYPEGRIDSFKVEEKTGTFEELIKCLKEFGFEEDNIHAKIDMALEERQYAFLYLNPKLKVHLSADNSRDFFSIRFDTTLPKEQIVSLVEEYFEFPN